MCRSRISAIAFCMVIIWGVANCAPSPKDGVNELGDHHLLTLTAPDAEGLNCAAKVYIEDHYSKSPGPERRDEDETAGPLYWSLPDKFRGDKVKSYGFHLRYTIKFTEPDGYAQRPGQQPDIILVGNDESRLYWHGDPEGSLDGVTSAPSKDKRHTYQARFYSPTSHPVDKPMKGKWTRDFGGLEETVSREDMMIVMKNLTDILIRATHDGGIIDTHLFTVELEHGTDEISAVLPENQRTTWVEECNCPANYVATSCKNMEAVFLLTPITGGQGAE